MAPTWGINNRAGCATRNQQHPAASPERSVLPLREAKRSRTNHVVKAPRHRAAPEPTGKPALEDTSGDGFALVRDMPAPRHVSTHP